ncbi:MAG: 30S ribosomal protein S3 [Armatimonadetes bacterium]|nr:30S ribosomal protein S3 [Armatimonadota bacterium]
MGQKVHPYGFRLVSIRKPRSRWFAEGAQYREQLIEDIKIRNYIHDRQRNAGISDIIIDRTADTITITIEAARPGIMIGRGGRDVDRLRQQIQKIVDAKVRLNVEETSQPDTCAQLVADSIAWQIERRVSPRRAMGQALERALEHGAQGVRCEIAGRIGGAEIARREKMGPEGRVPLQSLRADIDFGTTEARTAYGNIGVKVWVYKGDVLPPKEEEGRDVWEELEEEATRIDHEQHPEEEEGAAATTEPALAAQPEAEAELTEIEAAEAPAEEPVEAVDEDEPAGDEDETEPEAEAEVTEVEAAEAPAEEPVEAVDEDEPAGDEDETEPEAEAEVTEVEAAEPPAEEPVEAVDEDEPAGDEGETQPAVPVDAVEEEAEDVDA